ncbi:hypothetical protein ACH5RR_009457 [Cinchona calisaya]|uniref:Uncharacterized protein n=1 Tax=Cinchona calisaya TaxID=153742 RepID=A0ABD3AE74_9GENT
MLHPNQVGSDGSKQSNKAEESGIKAGEISSSNVEIQLMVGAQEVNSNNSEMIEMDMVSEVDRAGEIIVQSGGTQSEEQLTDVRVLSYKKTKLGNLGSKGRKTWKGIVQEVGKRKPLASLDANANLMIEETLNQNKSRITEGIEVDETSCDSIRKKSRQDEGFKEIFSVSKVVESNLNGASRFK